MTRMTTGAPRAALPLLLVLPLLASLTACGGGDSTGPEPFPGMEQVDFAPELGVDLDAMEHRGQDLYIRELEEGAGEVAAAGDTLHMHYSGWLPDGTEFDSNQPPDIPFDFVLGAGQVIAGWDRGVEGMRVGGTRLLAIPPSLGYGARGAGGVIPPNSALVFEVELARIGAPPEPGSAAASTTARAGAP